MLFPLEILALTFLSGLLVWRLYIYYSTPISSDKNFFQDAKAFMKEEFHKVFNLELDSGGLVNPPPLKKKDGLVIPSAVGEAGIYAASIIHNLLSVDRAVLDTATQLSHQTISNVSDLHTAIGDYSHSLDGGATQSVVEFFKGHLGEQLATNHVEHLGAHVNFPEMSNQIGYDFHLNGIPVNVKTIADANSLSEHFAKYPDIPAVVPSDAMHIPHDAIYLNHADSIDHFVNAYHQGLDHLVLVDPGLSNIDTVHHASSALDAASGKVDIHWPWVTTVLSTVREIKLLDKNYTSFGDSIKNISLDVAGTGIGAAAGAKAGALAGLIFGPIGAAIGGVVGAVAGGMGGRMISNEYKYKTFKELKARYEALRSSAPVKMEQIKISTQNKIDSHVSEKQQELNSYALDLENKINEERESAKKNVIDKSSLNIEHFRQLKQKYLEDVNAEINELSAKVKEIPLLRKIFPSKNTTLLVKTRRFLIRKVNEIDRRYTQAIQRIKPSGLTVGEAVSLFSILAEFKSANSEVHKYISAIQKGRNKALAAYSKLVQRCIDDLALKRKHIVDAIAAFTKREMDEANSKVLDVINELKSAQNRLKSEGRRVGLVH
jgi:gas vesicle protein